MNFLFASYGFHICSALSLSANSVAIAHSGVNVPHAKENSPFSGTRKVKLALTRELAGSWWKSLVMLSLAAMIGCDVNSFLQQVSQARDLSQIFSFNLPRPLTQRTEP